MTPQSSWPSGPRTTARWLGCVPVRPRAWSCLRRQRSGWRAVRSPNLWRSPKREKPCKPMYSVRADFPRCCCVSAGRRSTQIRFLPLRAVPCRMSLSGWIIDRHGSGADHRSNVPPEATFSTVNAPPTSSARRRRFVNPLPVMSPEMPDPLSTTSMVRSSSTLTLTVNVVALACRTALLTASAQPLPRDRPGQRRLPTMGRRTGPWSATPGWRTGSVRVGKLLDGSVPACGSHCGSEVIQDNAAADEGFAARAVMRSHHPMSIGVQVNRGTARRPPPGLAVVQRGGATGQLHCLRDHCDINRCVGHNHRLPAASDCQDDAVVVPSAAPRYSGSPGSRNWRPVIFSVRIRTK